jgi:hypothetical protein
MNMISTGTFQTEMDASSKQLTLAEKFAAVWEKKNAKAARAGGVSLMALSLAACGSDDATTTTATDTSTTTTTTVVSAAFDLTPLTDIASETQALNGSLASDFRFTSGNDTVNGMSATMVVGDTLLDNTTTDNDVMNVTVTGATNITTMNIETINLSYAVAASDYNASNTGTTAFNVSGSVAGILGNPTAGAEVTLDGFGRVLTIDTLTLTGTAALGSAESLNVTLSGATHGATAASQTGVTIDGTDGESLETLNITSSGDTANVFTLAFQNTETVGTYNILGTQDVTMRVDDAKVSGTTFKGEVNTGNVALSLDTNGNITINASNWSGVDEIILRDSAVGANNATLNSIDSGQDIVVTSSVGTLTPTVTGATFASFGAAADLDLNGSSTTAGVTVTTFDQQNTTALNLVSQGLASSTATTAANTITNLDGDYSTITITGDTSLLVTSLDVEAVQTATTATTARAVTVDASAMTGNAFVNITADADAKVSYTMTGTLGADTLVANASGSTLNGGAANDTLTGGNGTDAITGGAGTDHIDISYGTGDTASSGAGNDTFDINAIELAAVAQVTTSGDVDGGLSTVAAQDDIIVVVDGVTYATDMLTNSDTADDIGADFVAEHASAILGAHGVTVALQTGGVSGTEGLVFTGKADGTTFTADVTLSNNGVMLAVAETTTANTGTALRDTMTTISDFAAGDILDIDGIVKNGAAKVDGAGGYYEGAIGSATVTVEYDVVVLSAASYTGFGTAEAAIAGRLDADGSDGSTDDVVFVFLNSTTGTAQMFFDVDVDTDNDVDAADQIATFSNITNLTDLAAAFSADSFVI